MKVGKVVASGMLLVKLALVGFTEVLAAGGRDFYTAGQPATFENALALLFLPPVSALIFVQTKQISLVLLVLLNLLLVTSAVFPLVGATV